MEPQYDFIVVGGGNSGAVVASRIAKSNTHPSVLLIEAGGDNSRDDLYVPSDRYTNVYLHPEIRWDYRTVPQKHLDGRVLEYLRGKGLGGSSLANFLGYIRGAGSDYNTWAELAGDDSYRWENVVERYKEIEALHFDDDGDDEGWVKLREGVHGFEGPLDLEIFPRKQWPKGTDVLMKAVRDFGWRVNTDQNSGDLVGVGAVTTTTYKGRRTTSSSAFLKDPPPNFQILTDTFVHKLLYKEDSGTSGTAPEVAGVILAGGRRLRARKEVILSLGTIDTPKLLMLSGIGSKQELQSLGIPCVVDLPNVGKELTDHLYTVLRWGTTSDFSDQTSFQFDAEKVAAARAEWLNNHTGPDATRHLSNLIGFVKLDPERYSQEELHKLSHSVQDRLSQPDTPHFEAFLAGAQPPTWDKRNGSEALGVAVMLMNPQSRGSVGIKSSNPLAMPVIDVNFLAHPYDRRTYVDAIKETVKFIRSASLSKYIVSEVNVPNTDSDEEVLKWAKKNIMSVLHGCGTVKMGRRGDPTACLDSDMCVRGVKNLRVVDLSVCPVLTNNHTQSTAYLVGQIGWKKVAEKYGLEDPRPRM